jgi:hypothetical protein
MDLRMWAEYTSTGQLVNDVKGIYAGLVTIERKYVDNDQ